MEARSRRSAAGGSNYQGSLAAKSQAAASQLGSRASAALNRERLKDFNDVTGATDVYGTVPDKMSCVSGLDSEIDEWAALNKLNMLKAHQTVQQRKEKAAESKLILKEELKKQQEEFHARKAVFK